MQRKRPEFRRAQAKEAVAASLRWSSTPQETVAALSKRFGVPASTLYRWRARLSWESDAVRDWNMAYWKDWAERLLLQKTALQKERDALMLVLKQCLQTQAARRSAVDVLTRNGGFSERSACLIVGISRNKVRRDREARSSSTKARRK